MLNRGFLLKFSGICALRSAGTCGARRRGKKEGQPAVFLPLWTPTFPLLPNLTQITYM